MRVLEISVDETSPFLPQQCIFNTVLRVITSIIRKIKMTQEILQVILPWIISVMERKITKKRTPLVWIKNFNHMGIKNFCFKEHSFINCVRITYIWSYRIHCKLFSSSTQTHINQNNQPNSALVSSSWVWQKTYMVITTRKCKEWTLSVLGVSTLVLRQILANQIWYIFCRKRLLKFTIPPEPQHILDG